MATSIEVRLHPSINPRSLKRIDRLFGTNAVSKGLEDQDVAARAVNEEDRRVARSARPEANKRRPAVSRRRNVPAGGRRAVWRALRSSAPRKASPAAGTLRTSCEWRQSDPEERVAAQVKEVVVYADRLEAQKITPDGGENSLRPCCWRHVLRQSRKPVKTFDIALGHRWLRASSAELRTPRIDVD